MITTTTTKVLRNHHTLLMKILFMFLADFYFEIIIEDDG